MGMYLLGVGDCTKKVVVCVYFFFFSLFFFNLKWVHTCWVFAYCINKVKVCVCFLCSDTVRVFVECFRIAQKDGIGVYFFFLKWCVYWVGCFRFAHKSWQLMCISILLSEMVRVLVGCFQFARKSWYIVCVSFLFEMRCAFVGCLRISRKKWKLCIFLLNWNGTLIC